jgi:hypothetical protein
MNVLLIYNEVPENVMFFRIVDPTHEQLETLELAQGKLVNMCDLTPEEEIACDKIQQAISRPEHLPSPDGSNGVPLYPGWSSVWRPFEIPVQELPALHHGPWDRVYYGGLIL